MPVSQEAAQAKCLGHCALDAATPVRTNRLDRQNHRLGGYHGIDRQPRSGDFRRYFDTASCDGNEQPGLTLDRCPGCRRQVCGRDDSPWYSGLRLSLPSRCADHSDVPAHRAATLTQAFPAHENAPGGDFFLPACSDRASLSGPPPRAAAPWHVCISKNVRHKFRPAMRALVNVDRNTRDTP